MIFRSILAVASLAAAVPAAAQAQYPMPPVAQQACQRACLEQFVERYLAAMADGKVDAALFSPTARFTENGVELPLGNEGLWATTTSAAGYRLIVPDVDTQQVAALVTVKEQASSSATGPARDPEAVGLSLRLRIVDGRITEIEQIAARPERPLGPGAAAPSGPFAATGAAVEKLGKPSARFFQPIPAAERISRADLVAVGDAYFEAVERNTGKDYYPFTDDCERYENGLMIVGPQTSRTGAGCKKQLETSLIGAVTSIRDRRVVAVDRERGIVFAFAFFDHRPINWTWQLGELFKIEKGEISRIEAIFIRGPYGICSGWSTYEHCRSEDVQDVR